MKSPGRIILVAALIIVIAGTVIGLYFYNLKPKDLSRSRPDYVITSAVLQQEFESDETTASSRYINKILEVSGEIISAEVSGTGAWNVSLETENDFSKVICTFPDVDNPAIFKTGEQITIRGECSGFLMDVLLNNCKVIR